LLAFDGELLSLLESVFLLAANFDCRGDIEYGFLAIAGDAGLIDKFSYLLWSLGLHIAVKQESRIVLVVIRQAREVRLMSLSVRRVNESLQV